MRNGFIPRRFIPLPIIEAPNGHEQMSEVGKRITTAECRLVGLSGQDLVLSTASVAVAALFVGDLAGMSADRNRCDCILRGEFIDIERVEGGAVPFA